MILLPMSFHRGEFLWLADFTPPTTFRLRRIFASLLQAPLEKSRVTGFTSP